jgi:hypothetical protein
MAARRASLKTHKLLELEFYSCYSIPNLTNFGPPCKVEAILRSGGEEMHTILSDLQVDAMIRRTLDGL